MNDSEKIQAIINYYHFNTSELSSEIGLSGPQQLYNIQHGKHNISKRLARQIVKRFPDIYIDSLIDKNSEIQFNESTSNENTNNKFVLNEYPLDLNNLEKENIELRKKNIELENEINRYKEREKAFLLLLSTKEPSNL